MHLDREKGRDSFSLGTNLAFCLVLAGITLAAAHGIEPPAPYVSRATPNPEITPDPTPLPVTPTTEAAIRLNKGQAMRANILAGTGLDPHRFPTPSPSPTSRYREWIPVIRAVDTIPARNGR